MTVNKNTQITLALAIPLAVAAFLIGSQAAEVAQRSLHNEAALADMREENKELRRKISNIEYQLRSMAHRKTENK